MTRRCVVPGCPKREKDVARLPHPEKQRGRFDKWLEAIGVEKYLEMDRYHVYDIVRVCKYHFSQDQFLYARKLKTTSIPNIYLPDVLRKSNVAKPVDLPVTSPLHTFTLLSPDQVQEDFKPLSYGDPLTEEKIVACHQDLVRKKAPEETFDLEILEERLFVDGDGIWEVKAEEYIIPSEMRQEEDRNIHPCIVFITSDCMEQFKNVQQIDDSQHCTDHYLTDQTYIQHLEQPPSPGLDFNFQFKQDCRRKYGRKDRDVEPHHIENAESDCNIVEMSSSTQQLLDETVCVEPSSDAVPTIQLIDSNLLSTPEIILNVVSEPSTGPDEAVLESIEIETPVLVSNDSNSLAPPVSKKSGKKCTSNKTNSCSKKSDVVIPQAIRCDFCGFFVRSACFIEHTSLHYSQQS